MRKITQQTTLLLLLLLATAIALKAQEKIPVHKYNQDSNPYGIAYENVNNNIKIYGGATMFNFQNKSYSLKIASDELESKIGYVVGCDLSFVSLTFGGQYVFNKFEINNSDEKSPSLKGVDLSLVWNLPLAKKWFNIFIGGGYSIYDLSIKEKLKGKKERAEGMVINGAFLKGGLYLNVTKDYSIKVDYQQSVDMDNKFAYNRINLCLTVNF